MLHKFDVDATVIKTKKNDQSECDFIPRIQINTHRVCTMHYVHILCPNEFLYGNQEFNAPAAKDDE